MSLSTILSKLSRLGLLSVFCAGLFITSGELHMSPAGDVQIGNGGIQSVSAECGTGQGQTPCPAQPEDPAMNAVISLINLAISVLTFLITPLIMLAGWLLSPDWTFGEIFGLRPILHQLWILISNVVYVIFGFMLVFVAFANIFGGDNAKTYEMKTMLPKLVTGMLIVPFTWFIVSAVLSISNILTASVISLPMETLLKAGGETNTLLTDPIIPKNITFNKNTESKADTTSNGKTITNGAFEASDCSKNKQDCISIEKFLTNGGGGAYNLLSVYAYGIFRIQGYKSITTEQKINKVIDIANKLGFGIIFFIVFGILVIAIVYALFSRALILWLYAIFSPLFALTYVLGDKAKKLEKFTVKEFISLALVPVYVSAALAFGLMFLGLVMGATGSEAKTGDGVLKSKNIVITTEKATTTFKFGNGDNEVTFQTIGVLDQDTKANTNKALDIGKGIIGTIIMNVLALVILWMAVMAALGASKITEAAVQPIKGFGDEIGKLAMKAPQYIPIPLPSKDGKERNISMAGLGSVSSTVQGALNTRAAEQGGNLGKSFAETLGISVSELTTALNGATGKLQSQTDSKLQKEIWRDIYGKIGDDKTFDAHKDVLVPKFKEMLGATRNIDPTKMKEFQDLLDKDPKKFVVAFEQYMDTNPTFGGGMVANTEQNKSDTIFKAVKAGNITSTPVTVSAFIADTTKPNLGKIPVHIEGKSDISVETKEGRINHDVVTKQLQDNGITDKDEVKRIITEIEKQLPKLPKP